MAISSRQPGIYFHTASPTPVSDLPRMDVAGFVGFASNGPLHIPVLIEDMAHYRDIFGDDISLAWDSQHQRMQYSLLGSTLEAFFRNGGQRCWVVRVAADSAQTASFEIPGLYQVDDLQATRINARSPGHWAENLRLSTRLNIQSLVANKSPVLVSPDIGVFGKIDDLYYLSLRTVPADLQVGDLLELRCGEDGVRVYLFVQKLQAEETGMQLLANEVYWFEADETVSPPVISSPEESSPGKPIPLDEARGLALYEEFIAIHSEQNLSIRWLRFDMLVWQGDALQSQINNLAFHSEHPRFWGHLPDDQLFFGELIHSNPVSLQASMALLLEEISYPRFALASKTQADNANIASPSIASPSIQGAFLPLNMGLSSQPEFVSIADYQDTLPLAEDKYIRDGLVSFSADLFLDSGLADLSASNLINEANYQRFSLGRSLKGLHSLLAIEEVSMIAVPDILHRHWDKDSPGYKDALQAPELKEIPPADEYGMRRLEWTSSANARRYIVQQSMDGDFKDFEEHRIERPSPLALDNDHEWPEAPDSELKLSFQADCTRHYYFRVRAEAYGQFSPWSNTRAMRLPPTHFYQCENPDPALLGLRLSQKPGIPADQLIIFSWEAEDIDGQALNLAETFQLQRATDMDFIAAETIYPVGDEAKDQLEVERPVLTDSVMYFRIRAKSGDIAGPWSNTLEIHPEKLSIQTLKAVKDYDDADLKAVQFALIRLCAARADALAVLCLPAHYEDVQVSAAVDNLLAVQSIAPSTLSFASLYFPWLRMSANDSSSATESNDVIRLIPPAGAVCGKLAATANLRGAWIASENKPLQDVLGLGYELADQSLIALADKQVSIISESPRGFVVSRASTLSRSKELKPLNVRRLLSLLRRLALREGGIYLFEPNSVDFRNRVQHYWETRLNNIYRRGAFNGNSAEAAYRVVTDESVNDNRSLDLGRFVVELQVSPSQPLSFIHIRLTQNGSDQLLFQEL